VALYCMFTLRLFCFVSINRRSTERDGRHMTLIAQLVPLRSSAHEPTAQTLKVKVKSNGPEKNRRKGRSVDDQDLRHQSLSTSA
jgi:hypothetical protein